MRRPAQLPLPLPHRTALGRGDFLIASPNAAAVAWIDRWPDWPRPALALSGPAGSGKTHLGSVWRQSSGAAIVAGPELASTDIEALIAGNSALLVEGADEAPEHPLFHLLNRAAECGRPLLLIAREAPARWGTALPDLASRLAALPVAAIHPPDDALIGAVLIKLFADRQLAIPEDALAWLITHMERSFAAANRLAAVMDELSLARRRPITLPLAREALAREMPG